MIGLANTAEVDALWPQLAPRFQEAIDRFGDDLSVADLWQMCRAGQAFLMVALDGQKPVMGAVLQFQKWTNGTVLRCLILGGNDMDGWLKDFPGAVVKVMKEGGARRFIYDGRDGWAEVIKHWKPKRLRATYEVQI